MTTPTNKSMELASEITGKWFDKNIGSFNSMGNCRVSESDLIELELAIAEALDAELARSAKLVEALEFYADQGNWEDVWHNESGGRSGYVAARIHFDDCERLDDDVGPVLGMAGNRARTALAALKGTK